MPTNVPFLGLPFSRGIQPTNRSPVDAYIGPYGATTNGFGPAAGTTAAGICLANDSIPGGVRYQGQQVVIHAWTPSAGRTLSYQYWYSGGTADGDLIPVTTGGGGVGDVTSAGTNTFTALNTFTAGLSASGATFGVVLVNTGITTSTLNVTGNAALNGNIFLGNESSDTITATGTFAGITVSTRAATFNAGATTSQLLVTSTTVLNGAVTANGAAQFNAGVTANRLDVSGTAEFASAVLFDTVATFGITAGPQGVTHTATNIPAGTSLGTGFVLTALGNAAFNGNVLIGPSGGVLAGGTQGTLIVRNGTTFERSVDFAGAVRAGTFTGNLTGIATQVSNSISFGHLLSGGAYNGSSAVTVSSIGASLGANTFTGLQSSATGFSGPLLGNATTSTTATQVSNSIQFGHLLSGGPYNGSSAVTVNSTGASLGANTFTGLQNFASGLCASASTFNGNLTVNGDATIGATLTVNGNFFVAGTVTTVNRVDLEIDDKLIVLGRTLDNIDSVIDGAGIWLGASGAAQAAGSTRYLLWRQTPQAWESGTNFNVPSGYGYKINNITALDAGQIHGLSVSNAIVSAGTWQGNAIGLQYGGFGANISGITTGAILWKTSTGITGTVDTGTSGQLLQSQGSLGPNFISRGALTGLTAESINADPSGNFTSGAFHGIVFINPSGTPKRAYVNTTDLSWIPNTLTLTVGSAGTGKIEAIVDGGVW